MLTAVATLVVSRSVEAEAGQEFVRLVDRIAAETQRRLQQPVYGLKGLRGLFAAEPHVSGEKFRDFVRSRDLASEFPGVPAFGFIEHIKRDEVDRFLADVRADSAPGFTLQSSGAAADLYVIRQIEPLATNVAVWGLDLGSDPVRRAAIERAVASGQPTLTAGIPLLRGARRLPGFLLVLPVYRQGAPLSSDTDRRFALRGLLTAPIVAEDILAGVVDSADKRLDFEIYDGPATTTANRVFDFDGPLDTDAAAVPVKLHGRRFETQRVIAILGRELTLTASTMPAFDAAFGHGVTWIAAAAGALTTSLAAWAAWLLAAGKARIERRARILTADLDRQAKIVERTSNAVSICDAQGRIVWINEGFTRVCGYALDEAAGRTHTELVGSGKTAPAVIERLAASLRGGTATRAEVLNVGKEGREYWLHIEIQPMTDGDGKLTGFMQIGTDITALKQTERSLSLALEDAAALSGELATMALVARYTSNAVIVTDIERRVRWVNEGFERITGYRADEAIGRSPGEMLQCERSDQAVVARMREALEAKQGFRGEIVNRSKDGAEYWIAIEIQPLRDAEGTHTGYMAIETDVTEAKAAVEALARERTRLAHIVRGTHAGEGDFNVRTGELRMSEGWAAMLGYTLDDIGSLASTPSAGLYHPDDMALVGAALGRCLKGPTPHFEAEYRMRHRDGRWIWMQGRGTVSERNADGRAEWITGVHIDITDRREAEQRWQGRAELSGDWYWQSDAEHRLSEIAVSADRPELALGGPLVGLRRDEIEATLPPEGGWPAFHALLDRHEAFKGVVYRVRNAAGATIWREIDGRPRFDGDGAFLGYEGVGRDVTEQRRITADLRESLALVDTVLEAIPIPVVQKDMQLRYRRVNKAYAELFGVDAASLLGKTAHDLIDAAAARRHDDEDRAVLASGGTCSYELQEHLGGRDLDALISKAALVGADGKVFGLVGTAVDISQGKAAERAMADAAAAADAANSAKSAFLATMSHEIRTPMNGVIGMAELLTHSALDAEQAQTVQTITDSAQALLALIDDILDFSKIEAGRLDLEMGEFEITALSEGVCAALMPVAFARDVQLNVHVEPRVCELVIGDALRVRQLLNNLIGNAIKFSGGRPGVTGRVDVRVESDEAGIVRFIVADNGIGMDEESMSRLFKPFSQAEVSTTRRFGGTGLGLAICHRLVEMMAGRIDVQSLPGHGSTFSFELPLRPAQVQPAPTPRLLQGVDCFIVPGPGMAPADLGQWLTQAGADVTEVATLDDARARLCHRPSPAVVVHTDIDAAVAMGKLAGDELRQLVVRRGRGESVRSLSPSIMVIDLLRREPFLRAIAGLVQRLPVEAAVEATPSQPAPLVLPRTGAPVQLILVAEDDATNRDVLRRQFELLGHAAEFAENGLVALSLWRTGRHALLLSDLHMPEMDGYALTRAIRSEEASRGCTALPILALTANAFKGEAARARAVGFDDYLVKPVSLKVLQDALRQRLPATAGVALGEEAPPTAGASRVLNLDTLRGLIGDDESEVRELLSIFLPSARTDACALSNALRLGDIAVVGAIAHKLDSASRSIGATALADICARLQRTGGDAQPQLDPESQTRFDAAFAAAETAVVAYLEGTPA